jgi:hypothetical protein
MSYIILKGRRCHIFLLNVHAPREDKTDDVTDSFYEELVRVFDKFTKYHVKILLGDFSAKVGREGWNLWGRLPELNDTAHLYIPSVCSADDSYQSQASHDATHLMQMLPEGFPRQNENIPSRTYGQETQTTGW